MAKLFRKLSRNSTDSDDISDTDLGTPAIHKIKLLTIGDSGVGKSSLVLRFTEDIFVPAFITTIGIDYKMKDIELFDGTQCRVQVWDTAGQERFKNITNAYYRCAQGILLVYDISDEVSFLNVRHWLRQIDEHSPITPSIMLIGNKSDMEYDRQVTTERGQKLAEEFGILFFETSAKQNKNIEQCFEELINEVIHSMEKRKHIKKLSDENIKLHDSKFDDKFQQIKDKIHCNRCNR